MKLHTTILKSFAAICGILLTGSVFSQTINLSGTIKDGNATAISGVKVSLKNKTTVNTTTNASGYFSLISNATGVNDLAGTESISFGPNGLVYLYLNNEPLRISIYNVSGQLINSIESETRLNGSFQVCASAYVPQDNSIFIVRVMAGNEVKSTKFISNYANAGKGISETSGTITRRNLKSSLAAIDTMILTHSTYKTLRIGLSSYNGNLGTITMEALPLIPTAPGNLTTTAVSSTQINLSWTDNSNNETTFSIERAPGGTTSFTEITTVGAGVTSYQNTGLIASTSYAYRVRAHNSAGYSSYTNSSTATTQALPVTAPAAPSLLSATTVSSTQINLSWTDNSTNETTFAIERAPGGTTSFTEITTVGAGVTTYQNTGLTASTSYSYRVRAHNSAGYSSYTNSSTATTQAPPATTPAAPSLLSATTVSSTQINLNWTDNSNNETSFSIERAPGGTTSFTEVTTVGAGVTTYQNTGLTASTGYVYRVRAHNTAGYSSYTNTATATTQATPQQATLRFMNNTKYAMVSIQLNGIEQLPYKNFVPAGSNIDYSFNSAGSVSYSITVGLMDNNGKTTDFFTYTGTAQIVAGQIKTVSCTNPTIGELLSGLSSSKKWSGYYFDANANYFECYYIFYNNGTFKFYDNGVYKGSGNVTLVSWDDYAVIVSFKLGTNETIQMMYPFASFMQSNGPASWKVITYTQQ